MMYSMLIAVGLFGAAVQSERRLLQFNQTQDDNDLWSTIDDFDFSTTDDVFDISTSYDDFNITDIVNGSSDNPSGDSSDDPNNGSGDNPDDSDETDGAAGYGFAGALALVAAVAMYAEM